jgi:hypothetical protein
MVAGRMMSEVFENTGESSFGEAREEVTVTLFPCPTTFHLGGQTKE